MSTLFGAASASNPNNTQGDLSKDVELTAPPDDTVTDISFSPAADLLAISSWDKKVRIYEVNGNGQSQGKHMYENEAPVFSVDWSKVSQAIALIQRRQVPF
jgi:mRNA export factor